VSEAGTTSASAPASAGAETSPAPEASAATSASAATQTGAAAETAAGATPAPRAPDPGNAPLRLSELRVEAILFAVAFLLYALASWGMFWHQSEAPHFVLQAEAFLHGQLHLLDKPPNLNDWVLRDGKWFVSFPPFPALVMMQLVALFGRGLNDAQFTVAFAALNVALLYRFLRRLAETGEESGAGTADFRGAAVATPRDPWDHAWLAILYGFGTLALSCSIRGEVWFTAQTMGVTLTLGYLLSSLRARRPLLAGLLLGCAAITRTPLLFSIVFFLLEAVLSPADGSLPVRATRANLREALSLALTDPARRRLVLGRLVLFGLPFAAVMLPMAYVNFIRFGSPGEFGHSFLYANRVNADINQYGLFHYHYLERNLHAAFTRLPLLSFHPLRLGFDGHGLSLLVTTPLFALLLWPLRTPRLTRALWLTVAAVALPGLLYQNDGYFQFGFRFSLDYTPHLFALLSLGGRPLDGKFWALGWAGVAVNAWGAAVFNRFF
jgi:hypothetical protein